MYHTLEYPYKPNLINFKPALGLYDDQTRFVNAYLQKRNALHWHYLQSRKREDDDLTGGKEIKTEGGDKKSEGKGDSKRGGGGGGDPASEAEIVEGVARQLLDQFRESVTGVSGLEEVDIPPMAKALVRTIIDDLKTEYPHLSADVGKKIRTRLLALYKDSTPKEEPPSAIGVGGKSGRVVKLSTPVPVPAGSKKGKRKSGEDPKVKVI